MVKEKKQQKLHPAFITWVLIELPRVKSEHAHLQIVGRIFVSEITVARFFNKKKRRENELNRVLDSMTVRRLFVFFLTTYINYTHRQYKPFKLTLKNTKFFLTKIKFYVSCRVDCLDLIIIWHETDTLLS